MLTKLVLLLVLGALIEAGVAEHDRWGVSGKGGVSAQFRQVRRVASSNLQNSD